MTTVNETEVTEGEIVDAELVPVEEPRLDVAVRETYTPSKIEGGLAHFDEYLALATRIAKTSMVPTAIRNNGDQVLAIFMYGAELGMGPMQSLNQINFIEGQPSLKPEAMRALIRKAGHKLEISQSKTRCVIIGTRADTGEIGEAEFTIEDAVDADLCQVTQDGKVFARSSGGKKLAWEKYTKDLLLARATSRIARMMFSDVTAGLQYTPEEIESFVDAGERPVKAKKATKKTTKRGAPRMPDAPSDDQKLRLNTVLSLVKKERKPNVEAHWKQAGLPIKSQLNADEIETAIQIVTEVVDAPESDLSTSGHETGGNVSQTRSDTSEGKLETPMMTQDQNRKMRALVADLEGTDGDVHVIAGRIVDREITSLKQLTRGEAKKVIDQLLSDIDARS
jgi:hypothetical protein